MATQDYTVEAVSPTGELIWPTLIKPDTKFDEDGVYKTKLKAKGPQAEAFRELIEKVQQEELERQIQDAEAKKKGSGKHVKLADIPVEVDEDGSLIFNFKSKAKFTDQKTGQKVDRKVALFDGEGNPLTHDLKLGSGSIARISCFVAPFYTVLLGAGATLRLRAVQILVLKEYSALGSAEHFGLGADEYRSSHNDSLAQLGLSEESSNEAPTAVPPEIPQGSPLGLPRLKDRTSTAYLVIHCSETVPALQVSARFLHHYHQEHGFVGIGYHYVIKRDGTLEVGRRESEVGAHRLTRGSSARGSLWLLRPLTIGRQKPRPLREAARLGATVVKAVEAMNWLQHAAALLGSQGLPVRWTTPAGFTVWQEYRKKTSQRVETVFGASLIRGFDGIAENKVTSINASKKGASEGEVRVQVNICKDSPEIDKLAQKNGISPNFVHSMDASHMMQTVSAASREGIASFAMIHDSFGTHAGNSEILFRVVREQFARTYVEQDVLEAFAAQVGAQLSDANLKRLPLPPLQGSLSVGLVGASKYAFA